MDQKLGGTSYPILDDPILMQKPTIPTYSLGGF